MPDVDYEPFTGADPKTGDPMAMRGRSSSIADWVIRHAQGLLGSGRPRVSQPSAPQAPVLRVSPSPVASSPSPTSYAPVLPAAPAAWPSTSLQHLHRREPWFGPGQAMRPAAPKADVAGRAFDYPTNFNMGNTPRQYSGVSFDQLRTLADALDIVRLAIETRKDQMSKLTFSILPLQHAGQALRGKADDRCREVETFLRFPDKKHSWDGWMRLVLEDQFVIDAASIYMRRTNAGKPYSLDVVDGTTIKPLLDVTGRQPDAPEPAFQQVLKGMPAVNYTADELIYGIRNPRVHKAYGFSVVEQIMMTVNIGIRREVAKLQYFTEGNIPEALISAPEDWSPDTIRIFQANWDAMLKASHQRAGLKFVPGKMNFIPTRSDGMLMGPFDEWIARIVCYAFSLPPTAFVQQQNRATAEQAHDAALEEGLAPLMVWFKGVMDHIVQRYFGYTDLEFVFDDVKQLDVETERDREDREATSGLMSIDEVRAKRGMDPTGLDVPFIMGIGPMGIMFVDDLLEAKKAGLLKMQPPAPPMQTDEYGNPIAPAPGMAAAGAPPQLGAPLPQAALPAPAPQLLLPAPGAGGAGAPPPRRAGPPPGQDPLALIPAHILAAVGLGPAGSKGAIAVTRKEEAQQDPEMAHVGHPQVLHTLRQAEKLIASRRVG